MERATTRITLDVQKIDSGVQIKAKRGDSARRLVVSLTNRGSPYAPGEGVTAVYYSRKADGVKCFNSAQIDGSTVAYDFTGQTTNVEGIAECEIRLYDAESNLITSPRFEMLVDGTVYQDGDIPDSSPEYTALTEMIARGNELIGGFADAMESMGPIRDEVVQAAEQAKADAEQAELSRVAAESARDEASATEQRVGSAAQEVAQSKQEIQELHADVERLTSHAEDAADVAEEMAGAAEQDALAAKNSASEAAKTKLAMDETVAELDLTGLRMDIDGKATQLWINPTDGLLYLLDKDDNVICTGVEVAVKGGGMPFDGGYQDENGYIHLTLEGEDVEWFTPFLVAGGGGGGDSGSRITFAMVTSASSAIPESAETAPVSFTFASVDTATGTATGGGTLQISVGGTVKKTQPIEQGENTIDVRSILSPGANDLALTITDNYGGTATRRISISVETLKLEWSLGNTETADGSLAFTVTPTGNYTKTVYVALDGETVDTSEVATSGRKQTKTIEAQPHGAHIVESWCTMNVNGVEMESDHLTCAVAWIAEGETAPVIALDTLEAEQTQFTTVNLVHRVIDPSSNPTQVEYLVDGEVYKTEEVNQSEQVWSYRLSAAGETRLSIRCGDIEAAAVLEVASIGADVEEVTDGLMCKVDPATMTDLSSWSWGDYSLELSEGFDLVNGGLRSDADGVRCIRITAGDRMTLNYPLFGTDGRRYGISAKFIYRVADSSSKEALAASCCQDGIGLRIQANNVYLSGNQTTCTLSTCEGEKTELDLNIQPDSEDGIMYLWEGCSTFAYMKYAADESFMHTSPASITFGCDEADVIVYLFRAYQRGLTDEELKANFVADGSGPEEILGRQRRNDIYDSTGSIDIEKAAERNPNCHHLVINAARMTLGKKDEVKGSLRHIFRAGGPEHQWTADSSFFVQGTSSVEHAPTAGPNVNAYFPGGIVLEDGTVIAEGYSMNGTDKSIPVLEFTYKKNIASEDHIVNRACAEWYNRFQPSVRPEREADSRVRDCLESTMCAVYFHNTGSTAAQVGPDLVPPGATIFFGLGNICSNKDSVNVFKYHPIVIEVKNNTEPQVRFKSDDLTGTNWSNNYEFRHLDTTQYTEATAKAAWQRVQTFLCETDCTTATGNALAETVTIGGVAYDHDTVAYRKARWDAESPTIFDKKTLAYHHNFTLFFLLRDNRAKNMFWSLNPATGKWGLWFNWDNDTGLCRNNDGYVDIEPGWMDFDKLGTGDCFNGADNVVFVNLRTWDMALLTENYLECESAGAWDIEAFYAYCMESQEQICEALWIEDAQHNAIRTMQNLGTSAYLERATGRLRLHIKKALTFQKVLVDSYYCSTAATASSAKFRGYKPDNWAGVEPNGLIQVVPYTNMWINIRAGSTDYHVRGYQGQAVELDISAELNNTEMYFRHDEWLQSISDLSGLYLGQFDAVGMKRNRRLLIGSSAVGYYNTNFTQADFAPCVKLEELNMGGLQNAKRSFDLSHNLYLRTVNTKGSGVTGVTFAKNGRLVEATLNGVQSLYMSGLRRLETFSMPGVNLTTVTIEDCPTVDSYAILRDAAGLKRARLMDIEWACENPDVLLLLTACGGKDDAGNDVALAVVTGRASISSASQPELDTIQAAFPNLELSCDTIVPTYTVTFQNEDGTVLDTQIVRQGGNAVNPVAAGRIDEPVKAPDVEYTYSYAGWDKSLQNIQADTVITALYNAADRYYVVTYWNDDSESRKLLEKGIIAHGSLVYTGATPEGTDGQVWVGWDKEANNVVSDMSIHAQFVSPVLPETVPEQYDYLYSNDPNDVSKFTGSELYGILYYGKEREYFALGDLVKIVCSTDKFTDTTILMEVRSYKHFLSAERDGFAGPYLGMVGVMNASQRMNSTNTNVGGWPECDMFRFLKEVVYPGLPQFWRALMERIIVHSSAGNTTPDIVSTEAWLTLESQAEVGFNVDAVPYVNEVAAGADEVTFACYTDNASRIKKSYNGTGSASYYWLRSPLSSSTTYWCIVNSNGNAHSNYATLANGVAFGFCLRSNIAE